MSCCYVYGNSGEINVTTILKNYPRAIYSNFGRVVFNRDVLKLSRELTDNILEFCQYVENIELSANHSFTITMGHGDKFCLINILQQYITIKLYDEDLPNFTISHIQYANFDMFLELFSQTSFYKRPEFIKVAARHDSD
jgi:hypothetical protein